MRKMLLRTKGREENHTFTTEMNEQTCNVHKLPCSPTDTRPLLLLYDTGLLFLLCSIQKKLHQKGHKAKRTKLHSTQSFAQRGSAHTTDCGTKNTNVVFVPSSSSPPYYCSTIANTTPLLCCALSGLCKKAATSLHMYCSVPHTHLLY